MYCLFLVLSLVLSLNASHPQIFNITKNYELEEFLCSGTQLLNDTTVKLSTNIHHFIRNASFCIINTTYSLSIISNSSQQAVIQCNDSMIQPTSGFAFTNIQNLTLQRLVLRGCGGYLKGLDVMKLINSTNSPLKFTQYQSAVLLFLHINTLLINEVNITYYYGFAVFAINPSNASINHSEISLSYGGKHGMNGFGSGIFLFFTDIIDVQPFTPFNVSIKHTVFKTNYAHHPSVTCLSDLMKLNIESLPIINAAGLTVFYTQKNVTAEVYVSQSSFISNYGALTGAVLVMYFNSVTQSQTVISSTIFKNNFINKRCPGTCISLFFHVNNKKQHYIENDQLSPLKTFNCLFFYDHLGGTSTTLGLNYIYFHYSLKVYTVVKFQNVNFTSIHSFGTGTCLYALSDVHDSSSLRNDYVKVIMENITAEKNVQISEFTHSYGISLFAVQSIGSLFLNGSSFFTDNQGSVFGVFNTKIVLEGILHFSNNFAYIGSVFNVIGSSWFILNDGLSAKFIGNSAVTKGGAIYAYNEQTQECMFTAPNGSYNISMLFHDNTASYSGNSIFSNNLCNCEAGYTSFSPSEAETFYHNISKGTLDGGLSTVVDRLCISQQNSFHCTKSLDGTIVYPGMTLHFPVAALDVFNQVTSAEISLTLLNYSTISEATFFTLNRKWYLESPIQIIAQNNCTMINVTFLKHTSNYHDDPVLLLLIKLSQNQGNPKIHNYLVPRECPVGFQFYDSSQKCDCSHALHHFGYQPVCKISSDGYNPLITITLPVKTLSHWIGIINIKNVSSFGVSTDCYHYCNFNNKYDTYIINDNNNSILITASNKLNDKAESLCLKNRAGTLCSQCAIGYSVVFGSNDCIRCSNWWLLTIIVYGIAGPLLVYLLYAFKLTLTTGEINGIIFYAQVMSIGRVMQLYTMKDIGMVVSLKFYYIFVRGLISLINLTINFILPLCLYDGMTELWKSGIGLMFPVYLLTIVIGLIIISRYSIRLSNRIADSSVQVLVTVVHLSFTTLLSSTLDVFTPVYIYTNTSDVPLKVWQNDGTVEYGKGGHLILMIVTGVVVGSILITYLTVLLAGRPLMKINKVREYLRPIYEAIHAPYKHNKEFFFSFSIILVAFLYLLSYIFIGNNNSIVGFTIVIPVTGIYFTIAAFFRPFKEMYINILNVIIFTVTGIFVGTAWFFYMNLNNTTFMIVSATCNTLVILLLVSIILFRIPFVRMLSAKFDIVFKILKLNKGNISSHCQRAMQEGSFFQSCDEREPLLYPPT